MIGMAHVDSYVGDQVFSRCGVLHLKYPMQRSIVTNWDDMERVWIHCFANELRVASEEHPVLLTEMPLNPKSNREKMTQLIFEVLNVPASYIAVQAVLSLYAAARTTGVVVECGQGSCRAVPVYEGFVLPQAVAVLELGGLDLTDHLMRLMSERGYHMSTRAERDIMNDAKEKLCFLALDLEAEMEAAKETSLHQRHYELPDGDVIDVGSGAFRCPELLFQPALGGVASGGLHELVFQSVTACDVDVQTELFGNVVLAGGSSMFAGFAERMAKELMALAPPGTKLEVVAPPDRKYAAWCGGSIIASLGPFEKMWVTMEDYEETGPEIVHKKCF